MLDGAMGEPVPTCPISVEAFSRLKPRREALEVAVSDFLRDRIGDEEGLALFDARKKKSVDLPSRPLCCREKLSLVETTNFVPKRTMLVPRATREARSQRALS